MNIVVNYALHLVAAGLLLFVFFLIYTWAMPFKEITLIRQGNVAAALTYELIDCRHYGLLNDRFQGAGPPAIPGQTSLQS